MKSKQKELNIFVTPLNAEPTHLPDNLKREITELQSNDELEAEYNLPLLDFYKPYARPHCCPILRRRVLLQTDFGSALD